MADDKAGAARGGVLFGWLKGVVTSIMGLVGGACLMYFSPLVNHVIQPGAPIANFQTETNNLKVVFHNRSSNGSHGWWDFGDGSALEPFQPNQESVTHTYAQPGSYTVKLSVSSLFGQNNDRSVSLVLNPAATATAPVIDTLTVEPLQSTVYAPATFKVTTALKNAELCVWALGGDHPIEVVTDTSGKQERYVTYKYPGTHVIKLAAYGNKQTVEKAQTVRVDPPPAGAVMAVLNVTHQAVHVTTLQKYEPRRIDFPALEKGSVVNISRDYPVEQGWSVVGAKFSHDPAQDANVVRNARLEVLPDRRGVRLTCDLLKNARGQSGWTAPIFLTLERRTTPVAQVMGPVAARLVVPGVTMLPLPTPQGGWASQQHSLSLVMQSGERILWQTGQLPRTDQFVVNGRAYRISATEAGNQVQVQVDEVRPGTGLVGN